MGSTSNKIPFGLRNGRIVEVSEVERGLKCECVCPACKAPLVAHHGTKVASYFSHYSKEHCEYAAMTAIHKAAQQLIADSREFSTPPLIAHANVSLRDEAGQNHHSEARREIGGVTVKFIDTRLEAAVSQMVVDVLATTDRNQTFIIEIAVTNPCGPEKIQRLESLGYPAVEVDLSHLPRDINMRELAMWVLKPNGRKRWLFNPKQALLQAKVSGEATNIAAEKMEAAALQRAERAKWIQEYRLWSPQKKLGHALWRMRLDEHKIPPYLKHPTRGDRAFACRPEVWQCGVFADLIHKEHLYAEITSSNLANWLSVRFMIQEPFPDASKVAVWDFLENLCAVGCLEKLHGQSFAILRSTVQVNRPGFDGGSNS